MKHCIHRALFSLFSIFILFLFTQPGNTQINHRWDFDFGKEGWEAGGTAHDSVGMIVPFSFTAKNGELVIKLPSTLTVENLSFKRIPGYITKLENMTIYLTSSHSFYIQVSATSLSGDTVKSNTIHQSPTAAYQEITLVFDNPISNPKKISINLHVENEFGKELHMNVDWIEANTGSNNNDFNLSFDPPGNVIQKGKEGIFNIHADWSANQNLLVAQKQPFQLPPNIFNLIEDSPHGELLDLVVGENSAQAKFLFTAEELGKHLVNFTATLENLPGNPLEITKQLPIYVTDFDPQTLFSETSSAENWMLYKN